MAEFTVSELNKENITNLYLYGQLDKPENLVDDNLIREPDDNDPSTVQTIVNVDAVRLMETGSGRFAVPAQFELVQKFFDSSFDPTPGEYFSVSKSVLNDLYFGLGSISWQMRQVNYDDGQDNLTERAYIWNNMAFQIANDYDIKFVIEPDGTKKIENFYAHPRLDNQDNFDFTTDGLAGIVANNFLEPRIDPSGIGRTVNINFNNINLIEPIETYTQSDFYQDLKPITTLDEFFVGIETKYFINLVTAGIRIFPERDEFINQLFTSSQVTKFLDSNNRPIMYGTVNNDNLFGADVLQYPTLSSYIDNGVVLIAGKGKDTIYGSSKDDFLHGGEGNDDLYGLTGEDTAVYKGSLSEYDIEFLSDNSVRITDTVNSRDDIDLLNSIEKAVFSDKTVNLRPGQDIAFVIDTTGSMIDDIAAVKANAQSIINTIFDNALNSRIAVVGYNDPGTNTFLSFTD